MVYKTWENWNISHNNVKIISFNPESFDFNIMKEKENQRCLQILDTLNIFWKIQKSYQWIFCRYTNRCSSGSFVSEYKNQWKQTKAETSGRDVSHHQSSQLTTFTACVHVYSRIIKKDEWIMVNFPLNHFHFTANKPEWY